MRVMLRPPTIHDIDDLARTMRPMDVKECRIVANLAPREALVDAVENADWSLAALIQGRVVGIFGVTSESFIGGGDGHPWLLCADGIERHAKDVLECSRLLFSKMTEGRQRLSNIVHAHNRSAIRFIKWCVFTLGEEVRVGDEPFYPFEWREAA